MKRHMLGDSAGGVAGMQFICDLLAIGMDPQSTFQEYTEVVGKDLTGAPVEAGFPMAIWRWAEMAQSDFQYLLNLVSNGASATVYLRTRNNSGALGYDFANYSAVLARPQAGSHEGLVVRNVVLQFSMLVPA